MHLCVAWLRCFVVLAARGQSLHWAASESDETIEETVFAHWRYSDSICVGTHSPLTHKRSVHDWLLMISACVIFMLLFFRFCLSLV